MRQIKDKLAMLDFFLNMVNTTNRLELLREELRKLNLDAFVVPSEYAHQVSVVIIVTRFYLSLVTTSHFCTSFNAMHIAFLSKAELPHPVFTFFSALHF